MDNGGGSSHAGVRIDVDPADAIVATMFAAEGANLVRLARIFTDDRNAAEDLVQEAFIRLHRAAHRINDPAKAAPYLRSIVVNLARDHNRRGLMSLRHQEALTPASDRTPRKTCWWPTRIGAGWSTS